MIFPFLLAAALQLDMDNKVVKPRFGKRIVIQTAALLGGSKPGAYEVTAHSNTDGNVPGEVLDTLRVRPKRIQLRDAQARKVTLSIDSNAVQAGVIWLCIAAKPESGSLIQKSGANLQILTRSCYQRIVEK